MMGRLARVASIIDDAYGEHNLNEADLPADLLDIVFKGSFLR